MRYIYAIILILILATAGLFLADRVLFRKPRGEIAFKVNDRVMTVEELDLRRRYAPYAMSDPEGFVDNLVIRELLIQEARRRRLDRRPAFQLAMEEHYEQSLIRQLLDSLKAEIRVHVDDSQIKAYREAARSRYVLTRALVRRDLSGHETRREDRIEQDFVDLPPAWQLHLLGLKEGESCPVFPVAEGDCVLRIEKRLPASGPVDALDAAEIRSLLEESTRQARIDAWIDRLRRDADIDIRISAQDLEEGREG
ncbi:MAG: hypothetical protein D6751_02675 [Deltaproteobacteria bacterium]|nr:MAG: hypothetical protein D6751_02675 [Deltaproteobacteria bacterium]